MLIYSYNHSKKLLLLLTLMTPMEPKCSLMSSSEALVGMPETKIVSSCITRSADSPLKRSLDPPRLSPS